MIQKSGEEQGALCSNSKTVNQLMLELRKAIPSLKDWVDSKGNFYPAVERASPLAGSRGKAQVPVTDPLLGVAPTRDKRQFRKPGELDVQASTNAPDDVSIVDASKIIQVALGELTRRQEALVRDLHNLTMVSILMRYIVGYVSDEGRRGEAIGDLIRQVEGLGTNV